MIIFRKIAKALIAIVKRVLVDAPLRLLSRLEGNAEKIGVVDTITDVVATWATGYVLATFFPVFVVITFCLAVCLVVEQVNFGSWSKNATVTTAA